MNQNTILFALIRSAIYEEPMTEAQKALFTEEQLPELLALSQKHDIAQLIARGLYINELTEKNNPSYEKLQNLQFLAVYRYEQLNYELERLCQALEAAEIPFIPLKGSVIRKYYTEPWLRTSCDIDVLIHEDDLERSVSYLIEHLKYTSEGKGSHNVSLFSPNKNHIELHYDLMEEGLIQATADVLKKVWNTSVLCSGYRYWYEMTDEMFYFYHIAHMAKHLTNGGCGIRPFIDLYILNNLDKDNTAIREELLRQGGILRFADVAGQLSRAWLDNARLNAVTEQMQDFILRGGVYGTSDNRIMVQQQRKGGRFRYMLSRIFQPYGEIKFQYPILEKYSWLTPVMEVRRWGKIVFRGRVKHAVRELSYNQNISGEKTDNMKQFLQDIGL